MKRYLITLGATTTAGGTVISASSHASISGARIALEGDLIQCTACHAMGVIQCTQARPPATLNGKAAALSDDLCRCACLKPHKLIATQSQRYQQLPKRPPATETTMTTTLKVLWAEGLTLDAQHLQQQDRYHESRLQHIAATI